ncbi:MAG: sulfite exporter TauE/SafE family protein [Bdellovibrionia bacterium]
MENLQQVTLSGSILLASFLGSWHCAAMCGPVATFIASKNRLSLYHLGRLFSYATLGGLAGALGNVFITSQFASLRWGTLILFSFFLFVMGLRQLSIRFDQAPFWNFGFFRFFRKLIFRLQAFSLNKPPFVIGLLTALLPCGWLYSYVFAAVATQNAITGALIMVLFWLGGLPALLAMPFMIKKTIDKAGGREKKIAGIILIFASLYSLLSFYWVH